MSARLNQLIVTERSLGEDEIAASLRPYVRFTDRGELLPNAAFDALRTEARVACVVLASKALHLIGLRSTDGATPAEIAQLAGLPGGTVRPKLRSLLAKRCIARAPDGRYSVPPSGLSRIAEVIRDGS